MSPSLFVVVFFEPQKVYLCIISSMPTPQESLRVVHLQEFPEPATSRPVNSLRNPDHQGIYSEEFLD